MKSPWFNQAVNAFFLINSLGREKDTEFANDTSFFMECILLSSLETESELSLKPGGGCLCFASG